MNIIGKRVKIQPPAVIDQHRAVWPVPPYFGTAVREFRDERGIDRVEVEGDGIGWWEARPPRQWVEVTA